jgi:translation initiation factor IF-2
VSSGPDRRLIMATVLILGLMLGCTTPAPPPPAAKEGPAEKPAASPSPAAQASPTVLPPRAPVVGGGAAQPAVRATSQSIGGSAIIIVPTPNFSTNPTAVPAQLAPAVSLSTPQAANVPQVTGTLSRIPTAIPGPGGGGGAAGGGGGAGGAGGGGAAAAAAVVVGGGGGGGGAQIQTIPVVVTATPPVRINPQPQPAIVFPGGR